MRARSSSGKDASERDISRAGWGCNWISLYTYRRRKGEVLNVQFPIELAQPVTSISVEPDNRSGSA